MELLAGAASGEGKELEQIRRRLGDNGSLPFVWDPFAGFDGIPIVAQKLGLRTAANDLNPVASMLTRTTVDISSRFASLPPVHPCTRKRLVYSSAQGLAEDIRFYGDWVERQAHECLSDVYPQIENGEVVCVGVGSDNEVTNHAWNCHMPLGSSFVLYKAKTAQVWADPVNENGEIRFEIYVSGRPRGKESNKIGENGAKFRCPFYGEITTDEYIKKKGLARA